MMRASSFRLVTLAAALLVAVPLFAQAPKRDAKAAPAPTNTTPSSVKKPDLPVPPPNYEYSAEGRRDPFISLINKGDDGKADKTAAAARRADGAAGILTKELSVKGILQTRGAWVAMVAGPDKKIYTVRAGDKLADGVIRSVNATSVVILQEVNDPLSLEKQREVRKFLRGGDEVK
jgi:Tfp pilus assembly protein PilP